MSKADDAGFVSILRAEIGHADDLARLHAGLFDAPWDAASFKQLLADAAAIAFVACADAGRAGRSGRPGGESGRGCGQLCGFVVGRLAADEAEILTLGVAPNRQHLGIGRRLVEDLCHEAKKRGAYRLYLEVAAGNAAALALYDRLGFRESGRRRGYYARAGAPAEDAINLCLALERHAPPGAQVDDSGRVTYNR